MLHDDKGFLRQGPAADKARVAFQPPISRLLQSDHWAAFFPVEGIRWESPSFLPSGGLGSISGQGMRTDLIRRNFCAAQPDKQLSHM